MYKDTSISSKGSRLCKRRSAPVNTFVSLPHCPTAIPNWLLSYRISITLGKMDPLGVCFNRQELLAVLVEGKVDAITVENEKQLSSLFQQISDGLANEDDWQRRISALQLLQALAWGDLSNQPTAITLLRNISDKVSYTSSVRVLID
jgi:hypothetical protein